MKINERIVMHNFTAVGFYLIYSFPFKKTLPKVILSSLLHESFFFARVPAGIIFPVQFSPFRTI